MTKKFYIVQVWNYNHWAMAGKYTEYNDLWQARQYIKERKKGKMFRIITCRELKKIEK